MYLLTRIAELALASLLAFSFALLVGRVTLAAVFRLAFSRLRAGEQQPYLVRTGRISAAVSTPRHCGYAMIH
jgi:hypothetical protein